MSEFNSISIRKIILDLIKDKFGAFKVWSDIEVDAAMLCADLPEPDSEINKQKFIEQMDLLKQALMNHQIKEEDLEFLEEEKNRISETKVITLYKEEDDSLDPKTINNFCKIGKQTEGIIGIPLEYSYNKLKKLTNGVYKKTGLIKFYISSQITMYGKIVAEMYEQPVKIPVATLLVSKRKNEIDDPDEKYIALFGERINTQKYEVKKEITIPFYIYKFISEKNKEVFILCFKKQTLGDYRITGVLTHCNDYRHLTESARLLTKLPYMFVKNVQNRIVPFKNRSEYYKKRAALRVSMEKYFDYPFVLETPDGKKLKLKQPRWFKWFIWSWLLHQEKGLGTPYPFHITMIGPQGTGKSMLIEVLHSKSKETNEMFSGSGSTFKDLIPSFSRRVPQVGYLAESNRFAFCY